MIGDATARMMGIKFFREWECPEVAGMLDNDACLEDIFSYAVKSLGKARVLELYNKLPKQLKVYVLMTLGGSYNRRIHGDLMEIYDEYERIIEAGKPERMKGFQECYAKLDKVVVKYLKGGKNK